MAAPNVPFYSDRLGMVSARNESAGRNDAINTNDLKGIHSYGKWQIYGTNIPAYLRSMARLGGEYANIASRLSQYKVNSKEFDNAWRREANAHPDLIENSQYQFIKATHYDPVLKGFAPELQSAINSNRGLQEALWQATVLGPAAARGLFNRGWTEGKGDIRRLVDIVYDNMHNWQQSYIKEHPDHLPILLKQHNVSKGIIKDILNDPARNKQIVSSGFVHTVPSNQSTAAPTQVPVAASAPATPDTFNQTADLENKYNILLNRLKNLDELQAQRAIQTPAEQLPPALPETNTPQYLNTPVQYTQPNIPQIQTALQVQSPGKLNRSRQLQQMNLLQPFADF